MSGQRLIRVPKNYYDELIKIKKRLEQKNHGTIPLWRCTEELVLERQRWRDDEWFNMQRRK